MGDNKMPIASSAFPPVERVMVFIDGSNIFWASKARGVKMDYKKLVDLLVGGHRRLIRPYFYCAIGVPPSQHQLKFHDKLRHMGFEVVTKPLKQRIRAGRTFGTEKGVDVALVTDMLSMAYKNAYDTEILVGGDEDYYSAVVNIKQVPKRVEIAAFSDDDTNVPPRWKSTTSREMRMVCDHFYPLEQCVIRIKI